jgi:predicted metalloprotease with PDZ domain
VDKVQPRADVAGIEQGGYRLVYRDKPTVTEKQEQAGDHGRSELNCWFSLGLRLSDKGRIADVRWNGPSDKAQLAPGEIILAVNGEIYSDDLLRAAIRAAKTSKDPIRLIVQADNFVLAAEIDYHDGERYAALERIDGAPAIMDEITAPRTRPERSDDPKPTEE